MHLKDELKSMKFQRLYLQMLAGMVQHNMFSRESLMQSIQRKKYMVCIWVVWIAQIAELGKKTIIHMLLTRIRIVLLPREF